MSKLNLDRDKVQACRELARKISQRVQRDVSNYTTVSIERASLRLIGLDDAIDGTPVANAIVDAIPPEQRGKGALYWFGRALASQRTTPISLALRVAGGKISITDTPEVPREDIGRILAPLIQKGMERLSSGRQKKEQRARWPQRSKPLKCVVVGTGDVDQDIEQAVTAVKAGADCIAIQRSAGQSLMEIVPSRETKQGREGTFATQANCRKLRRALDQAASNNSGPVYLVHSSSGLCMPEVALIASVEGVDSLLNDALYGVLFRDINVRRAFADQFFARMILAHSGVGIHTGENRYAAYNESYRVFQQVLASHFLNEQFSFLSSLSEWQMGFSHAFEIDPEMDDGFLYELAQAQMVRECFPKAPIKFTPPTRHKTGDIFHSHVMDALFTLAGAMTHQDVQQLGVATEAIHHPLLMDRYWSLKAANYVLKNTRSLGDEIQWLPNGKVVRRARSVLDGAHRMLQKIDKAGGLFRSISSGYFNNIPRHLEEGVGCDGLITRESDYFNPVWEQLQTAPAGTETTFQSPRRRAERRPTGSSDRRSSGGSRRGRRPSSGQSSGGRSSAGGRGARPSSRRRSPSENRERSGSRSPRKKETTSESKTTEAAAKPTNKPATPTAKTEAVAAPSTPPTTPPNTPSNTQGQEG